MKSRLVNRLTTIVVIVTLGGIAAGVMGFFGYSKGWKEEVQLHDGQVMVVERHFNLGAYPSPDAHERALLDQTITFTAPGATKEISWHTEFRNDVPELNSLGPLLLDVVQGVPYLATSPAGCIAYNKWGRPNPPYVLFKYVNDAWQGIPLEEFPAQLIQANLMPTPASSSLKRYYKVAEAKAEREDGNMNAYAKKIVRQTVRGADAITSCPDFNSEQYRSPKAPIPMKDATNR